jgi:hypothetical protein
MSYHTEHLRMAPVLEKARKLDIASHPAPNSIFEALPAGFNIWCTPDDHPEGWEGVRMDAGAFSKPCEYVATATWGWEDEQIIHIVLETDAYALSDRDPVGRHSKAYHNRPEDVAWAKGKIAWLFRHAGLECPPVQVQSGRVVDR